VKRVARAQPAKVHLRAFRLADYPAVLALWRRSEGLGLNESDSREAISAYLRRNPRLSLVAERNGRLVGALLGGHDGRRGYLHHLAVARRQRRLGVGRRLVEECLARLARLGIPRVNIFVYADNAAGRRFWRRTGWILRRDLRLMQYRLGHQPRSQPD
jgi:N-acetylglutamate synthase